MLMQVCTQGHGVYMGMQCQWVSRYRPTDGAFLETIESSQLSFTYGHMGCTAKGRLSQSWAVCSVPLSLILACIIISPFCSTVFM